MPLSFVPYATPPTNELSKPDRIDTRRQAELNGKKIL